MERYRSYFRCNYKLGSETVSEITRLCGRQLQLLGWCCLPLHSDTEPIVTKVGSTAVPTHATRTCIHICTA